MFMVMTIIQKDDLIDVDKQIEKVQKQIADIDRLSEYGT